MSTVAHSVAKKVATHIGSKLNVFNWLVKMKAIFLDDKKTPITTDDGKYIKVE